MKTKERRKSVCHRGTEGTEIGEDGAVGCQEEFQLDWKEPRECVRDIPPRVFCGKSVDLLDSKGVEALHNAKEFATVSKERG